MCRRITLATGVVLLPALLFATAPQFWSGRSDQAPTDSVLTQRAVTQSAVILAKTVLPQSVDLMTTTHATPAVPVPIVSAAFEAPRSAKARQPSTSSGHSSSDGQEVGEATWYDYIDGTCAHVTLPMGTKVTVTRLSTGASTICRVADRGPFGEGRVIDLDKNVFAELGDPSEGVFQVSLDW